MHTVKEPNMLIVKIDLLLKRLGEWAQEEEAMAGTIQAMDSHMTCEVCRNIGHLGNDCPEPTKKLPLSTMGSQPGNNRWNN
jgi:hypothetical protein